MLAICSAISNIALRMPIAKFPLVQMIFFSTKESTYNIYIYTVLKKSKELCYLAGIYWHLTVLCMWRPFLYAVILQELGEFITPC